jgi:hypothetical protein
VLGELGLEEVAALLGPGQEAEGPRLGLPGRGRQAQEGDGILVQVPVRDKASRVEAQGLKVAGTA